MTKDFGSSTTAEEVIDKNQPQSLQGRIVIITGSNTGIGYETARQFYRKGATVIIASRSQEKMNEAKEKILSDIKNIDGVIETMVLDLASLRSISSFAEEFRKKYDKLHTLILNAGVMACPLARTEDGFEMQIGTNHFGHFALTMQLIDLMYDVEDPRIIALSSSMQALGPWYFDINDMNWEKRSYSKWGAYGVSKICNVIFISELHRRLVESNHGNVTVYSVDPGAIKTDLQRHDYMSGILMNLMWFIVKTIPQGAATTVNCATNPNIKDKSGKFFADCQEKQPRSLGYNPEVGKQLWELSEKLTNTSLPTSKK
jgi:NAD(P)-dependent dehydrogenase (short-subunit alcohol dehydrogenase family)